MSVASETPPVAARPRGHLVGRRVAAILEVVLAPERLPVLLAAAAAAVLALEWRDRGRVGTSSATPGRAVASPTRYVALLRGINLGRRNVKSARLREIFEAMGYANVETFIASGNVVFTAEQEAPDALAAAIETGLRDALGYDVRTILRTGQELVAVAEHQPFPEPEADETPTINIAFLEDPVRRPARARARPGHRPGRLPRGRP